MYSYIVKVKLDPIKVELKDSLGKEFAKDAIVKLFKKKANNFKILAEEEYAIIVLIEYEKMFNADRLLSDLEQLKTYAAGIYSEMEVFIVKDKLTM